MTPNENSLAAFADQTAFNALSQAKTTDQLLSAIRAVHSAIDQAIEVAVANREGRVEGPREGAFTGSPTEGLMPNAEGPMLNAGAPERDEGAQNGRQDPRDCKPGCDHCCHYVVIGNVFDVAAIVHHIQTTFTQQQQRHIKAKFEKYLRAVAPFFGRNLDQVRPTCPFLDEGLCMVYEARPLRCRGMNSLNVEACRQRRLATDHLKPLPMLPGQAELARAATMGLQSALARLMMFGDPLDVARAVGIALEEEHAIQRHLNCDHLLGPSVARPPADATMPVGTEPFKSYGPGEEATGRLSLGPLVEHFAFSNLGHTSRALERLNFDHPARLVRNLLVPPFYESECEIQEWRARFEMALQELEQADYDPREAFDALEVLQTFELAYHQQNDKDLMSRLGDVIVNMITAKAFPDLSRPIEPGPRTGRLKVGYISCNLSNSNGGYWSLGWIRNHGPEIESFALFTGTVADSATLEFRESANHFFHLDRSTPDCAHFVKSLGLDVLIYPDIGLAGRNYQYASMRLAPRQCTAWGHPVTSGLPTINYYLSSTLMEPANGQEQYREELVLLPGSGLVYPRKKTPVSRLTREDFRLDDGLLFLSCQNPMKLHPHWDFLYREINERTGRPIVFLEGWKLDPTPLKARMAKAGINAKWVPSLSAADFLGLLSLADVCLDTPGWNGGNTTIQELDLRKPVVSIAGDTMRGRHSMAFLPMAGIPGMIAASAEEYVELVCNADRREEAMRNLDPLGAYGAKECVAALDRFLLR